ncbi:MAG: hypothetical protein M3460_05865 [Actinomycetota bacterium]|nr:hypothetical protein [Actinomycetota bacterium]
MNAPGVLAALGVVPDRSPRCGHLMPADSPVHGHQLPAGPCFICELIYEVTRKPPTVARSRALPCDLPPQGGYVHKGAPMGRHSSKRRTGRHTPVTGAIAALCYCPDRTRDQYLPRWLRAGLATAACKNSSPRSDRPGRND